MILDVKDLLHLYLRSQTIFVPCTKRAGGSFTHSEYEDTIQIFLSRGIRIKASTSKTQLISGISAAALAARCWPTKAYPLSFKKGKPEKMAMALEVSELRMQTTPSWINISSLLSPSPHTYPLPSRDLSSKPGKRNHLLAGPLAPNI